MNEKRGLAVENSNVEGDCKGRASYPLNRCRSSFWNTIWIFAGAWLVYSGTQRLYDRLPQCKIQRPKSWTSSFLEVIQVYKPPSYKDASDNDTCTQTLMEHVFAFSYGQPFVGEYNPPACEWTHVTFNLSFVSAGVQFDRLALLYLDDTEIWRTSTAEPTYNGIHWEYIKDMAAYRSLLKKPGKLIMDLGNLVNEIYTGTFNGTLTATYYNNAASAKANSMTQTVVSAGESSTENPPDLIYPISAMRSNQNQGSEFRIPRDKASASISLETGSFSRASISISASGDSSEEFWYTNVPSFLANTFKDPLPKYSAFREVQIWLDGTMVGVAWPFPVIFTGGVSPGLWRPIVSIAAFDLVEYEVDVTPWLWKICDGKPHSWELKVVGIDDSNGFRVGSTVGWDWIVTGRLLLWNSAPDSGRTAGSLISHSPDLYPSISLSYSWSASDSFNDTLSVKLSVRRTLSTLSRLEFTNSSTTASFSQSLSFSSETFISARGANQTVDQSTDVTMASSTTGMQASFHFPLKMSNDFVFYDNGAISIIAAVDIGLASSGDRYEGQQQQPLKRERPEYQLPFVAAASQPHYQELSTRQNGTSRYYSKGAPGTTSGHTEQVYSWQEDGGGTYFRHVEAEDSRMVRDEEKSTTNGSSSSQAEVSHVVYDGAPAGTVPDNHENICLGRFEKLKLSRLLV